MTEAKKQCKVEKGSICVKRFLVEKEIASVKGGLSSVLKIEGIRHQMQGFLTYTVNVKPMT